MGLITQKQIFNNERFPEAIGSTPLRVKPNEGVGISEVKGISRIASSLFKRFYRTFFLRWVSTIQICPCSSFHPTNANLKPRVNMAFSNLVSFSGFLTLKSCLSYLKSSKLHVGRFEIL